MATASARTDPGELNPYRVELTGYCYRMLGSAFDAEDAVQETLLRAWRSLDGFEGRASVRAWLYRIATNVCLDMLRGRQRRALPTDLVAPSTADVLPGAPHPEEVWVQPAPDGRVLPVSSDPADVAALRETVRLAFVTALQQLPPRQRAVVILRDVLRMSSLEVADQLDSSVASVNGMLRRARAKLPTIDATTAARLDATRLDEQRQILLTRYVEAFERYDVDRLVALLHEDATVTMPPHMLWLSGRAEITRWFHRDASPCRGSRLVPVHANASPAFAQYHTSPDGGPHRAFAIHVVALTEARIGRIDFFLTPNAFALFDLPAELYR
jgi:RNA polymerase sigma-70 factor, ECF subfamily